MFLSLTEHYDYIKELVNSNPSIILISTFGHYSGILSDGRDTAEWGEKYKKETREIMDLMAQNPNINVKLLIGVARYFSCKGDWPCSDCQDKFTDTMARLVKHTQKFNTFSWKFTEQCHLKAFLAFYKGGSIAGVAGGRNFTDSDWLDVTFKLSQPQVKQLYPYVSEAWKNAKIINDINMAEMVVNQFRTVKFAK